MDLVSRSRADAPLGPNIRSGRAGRGSRPSDSKRPCSSMWAGPCGDGGGGNVDGRDVFQPRRGAGKFRKLCNRKEQKGTLLALDLWTEGGGGVFAWASAGRGVKAAKTISNAKKEPGEQARSGALDGRGPASMQNTNPSQGEGPEEQKGGLRCQATGGRSAPRRGKDERGPVTAPPSSSERTGVRIWAAGVCWFGKERQLGLGNSYQERAKKLRILSCTRVLTGG